MTEDDYGLDIDGVGVPRGEGESWQEVADRLRPSFDCCLCDRSYDTRGEATRCCSDRFD